MNQTDIETMAREACFSTDLQVKQQAEKMFVEFCGKLQPADYKGLMQTHSSTVIFVLMEYTYKSIENAANTANKS